jgi:TorA maturation chaperone TorD
MTSVLEDTEVDAIELARECLYRFLAAALRDPRSPSWQLVLSRENQRLACESAALLREEADDGSFTLAPGELPATYLDLAGLVEWFAKPAEELQAEYDRVFGLIQPRECPPYETEYHASADAFLRSQQMADVAGFYRAFGLEPCAQSSERTDCLPLEFEFMGLLLLKKRLASRCMGQHSDTAEETYVCHQAERSFVADHLAWWVPSFSSGLLRKAETGYYAELARLVAAFIALERRRLDVPSTRPPVRLTMVETREDESAGCAGCDG